MAVPAGTVAGTFEMTNFANTPWVIDVTGPAAITEL